jgi:hypothetical protein
LFLVRNDDREVVLLYRAATAGNSHITRPDKQKRLTICPSLKKLLASNGAST